METVIGNWTIAFEIINDSVSISYSLCFGGCAMLQLLLFQCLKRMVSQRKSTSGS